MTRSYLPAVLLCAALLVTPGCAAPPNKEMDMAQGAIDAARAAGAEQYATPEYTAATSSLQSAHEAASAGDYRLALNHALTSHERAQNAARETANSKAAMRAGVERTIAELDMAVAQAETRLTAARGSRVPQRLLAGPVEALATIRTDVQEARTAVGEGNYLAAEKGLEGIRARIDAVLAAIAEASTPPAARRRR